MTLKAFPLEKNKILVRVTNLADRFDTAEALKIQYFNLQEYGRKLYIDSNRPEN